MTQRNDLERVLDAWLAEGPTQVPDRVFDDAIEHLYRQPQPSAWRSRWRTFDMTAPMRLAAALAVVAIVGAGVVLLGPGNVSPPRPTAVPSPSVLPTPTSLETSTGMTLGPPAGVDGAADDGRCPVPLQAPAMSAEISAAAIATAGRVRRRMPGG